MNDHLRNLLAGTTQATLVTAVGYPFDLVKARMQTGAYTSSWDCIKSSVTKEGPIVLYRGSLAPWISHLIKRPVQYPIAERLKANLPGTANNYLIGGVTGLVGPIIGTPLQVIKLGMQTSKSSEYTVRSYLKYIIATQGLKGLYRGFIPTVAKDCLFGASFLGHYYTLRDYFTEHPSTTIPTWTTTFISGAAAHCATWLVLIPIDTIKSKVQKAGETRKVSQILQETSLRSLWRGVLAACLRTIPVSGVAMVGYEWIRKYLATGCTVVTTRKCG